jgi:DNA mismatch endonuclease (patch repair protein)
MAPQERLSDRISSNTLPQMTVVALQFEGHHANMSRIRSRDTKPELWVRRLIHSAGYRYRLHVKDLPGKPDLVFPARNAVIFVHGCFWHSHGACREGRIPDSNQSYWGPKLARNVERDAQHVALLKAHGWRVLTIWECEIAHDYALLRKIKKFLERGRHQSIR